MSVVFVLFRTLVYASLFIGVLLIWIPGRLLGRSGLAPPAGLGPAQIAGAIVSVLGALLAVWCIATFWITGRGTPAPFDPPRRLVERGPYRWVRNPMYVGAGFALAGAALFYRSLALLGYALVFLIAMQAFVVGLEEPTLRRTFGAGYQDYCRRVARWWPRRPRA